MPGRGHSERVVLLNLDSHRNIWNLPPGAAEEIAAKHPAVELVRAPSMAALRAALPRANVLYTWSLSRELFPHARRLEWVHTPAAGVEHFLHPAFRQSSVILTNCRGVAASAMADHVFALMLALARRLPEAVRFQSHQQWGQDHLWKTEPTPFTLAGKVLGIIGLGGVGSALARRALAFDMTVVATRRSGGKPPRGVSRVYPPAQLGDLLAESDLVALTVPLTPETRGLIGAKELRRMKTTAYLINVGRGEHIDEGALIRALREKSIAGAALDVFQREPLPKNSVLWRVPGLLISPHYAGTYPDHMQKATRIFTENLGYYLAGKTKKMKSVVDKQRGY